MTWKSILPIVILFLVAFFALGYLVNHIWYLLVPNIEAFTVTSITVDGKRIDRMCRIVRLGNDYLIPLMAASVLFDLEVSIDQEEGILLSDGKNLTVQMRLYDPLISINQEEMLLRTPPIESQSPMVPVELFQKLLHKDIRFEPPLKQQKWSNVRRFVTSALQDRVTFLNLVMGTLFTGLWVSMSHITRATHTRSLESRFWRVAPYILLVLVMLFYVAQVVTARIESCYL